MIRERCCQIPDPSEADIIPALNDGSSHLVTCIYLSPVIGRGVRTTSPPPTPRVSSYLFLSLLSRGRPCIKGPRELFL